MNDYTITWEEVVSYRMNVQAESEEEAKECLLSGEYDYTSAKEDGGELVDDSIEVIDYE